jgi:hypothetical protein
MNRPTFLEGVAVALILAIAGTSGWHLGSLLLPVRILPDLLIGGLATCYALYLLYRSPLRAGRLTALAAWFVLCLGLTLWPSPLLPQAAVYGAAMWLLRTACHHPSLLGAVADLVLQGLAAGAAVWAYRESGSLFLAIWSYFLIQALFAAIPRPALSRRAEISAEDPFDRAERTAEAALRRIASR